MWGELLFRKLLKKKVKKIFGEMGEERELHFYKLLWRFRENFMTLTLRAA